MSTLWKPFNELARWDRDFDHLFRWAAQSQTNGQNQYSPPVDIEERDKDFLLHADLPGITEKDIEITVQDGMLSLSGKREEFREENSQGKLFRERRYGSFNRSFYLGEVVDTEHIEASFKNGVLTVVLPKKAEAKPKEIRIKTS